MKRKLLIILGVILILVGIAGVGYAVIMQIILAYEKFGIILSSSGVVIIPDISLWGYLGIIPMLIGTFIFGVQL